MKVFTLSYLKTIAFLIVLSFSLPLSAQTMSKTYSDSWGKQGFNITASKSNGLEVVYSLNSFTVEQTLEKGINWHTVSTPGVFLFSEPGQPELPSSGRYLAVPKGATPKLRILDMRYETLKGIDVIPSNPIPFDTEPDPETRVKDLTVYEKDAFFPSQAVTLSGIQQIRGLDVVMLGVSPFQYNPVTKELKVLRDIKVEVTYDNGKGFFVEDKYRSPWWDQIMDDVIMNYSQIPAPDYKQRYQNMKNSSGFEYLIIVPDNADFLAWADTIKEFRTKQGIFTGIKTITEVGGNTVAAITNYISNAYNTWEIPPVAVLLMADYSAPGTATGITAPSFPHPYSGTYITDNRYADMTGNLLPDIAFARITGNNAAQLQVMVKKFIDYEKNPPLSPSFYNNPITALGWQTERWFQICSEAVGGFWKNNLGKNPVRINAIYSGTPGSVWSTATNTAAVVNYFGPSVGGREYIPATPSELGGWSGGVAANITAALNNGSFMLQHRDHGFEGGWGEPDYTNNNINSLVNTDLSFIMSINCLTGRFDHSSESFAEKFHRHTYNGQGAGALGLIAASQVSYSFVNDAYVWGMMDNMWPEFMPDYGNHTINRKLMPAFGNVAGKYFLQQSSWPFNTDNKAITYDLFHHHGDAFLKVFSEVPQNLTVSSPDVVVFGQQGIEIQADNEAFVALSWFDAVSGQSRIIAAAQSDGGAMMMDFAELAPVGSQILLTVTKQNHFRYTKNILVIPPDGAYVVRSGFSIDDSMGNDNGQADFGESFYINLVLENVGNESAENVNVSISCSDAYVLSLTNHQNVSFGTILAGETASSTQQFMVQLAANVPNQHLLNFQITIEDDSPETYQSALSFRANAPVFAVTQVIVDDTDSGNSNGRLDPGETATLIFKTKNNGNSLANAPDVSILGNSPYLEITSAAFTAEPIAPGEIVDVVFELTAHPATQEGTLMSLEYSIEQGHALQTTYDLVVGQMPQIIIGDGTQQANTYPFYNWYKANRSQMLYLGTELGEGDKTITELGFDMSYITPTAQHRDLTNFKIIVKPTTATTLTGAFVNTSDGTIVYQSPSYTMPDVTGWHVWDVQDFVLPAGQNLIVEVIWGIIPSYCASGQNFRVNGTQKANNRVVFGYSDTNASPAYNNSSNVLPNLFVTFLSDEPGNAFPVNFKVVSGGLDNPVENASITIGAATLVTNLNGEASLELFEGSYSYGVWAEGFDPVSAQAFEVVDQAVSIIVDFVPAPTYIVSFSVEDQSGNAVTDAQITFNNQTLNPGNYQVGGVLAGTHAYRVDRAGFVSTSGTAVVVEDDLFVDVVLLSGYAANFTITDGTNAVSGAKVSVNGLDVYSNSLGNASITLLPGTYPFTVTKDAYHLYSGNLSITDQPVNIDVNLSLITYLVTFSITDGTNNIEGATIEVNAQQLLTNAQGQAELALAPGTYAFSVSKLGFDTFANQFQLGSNPLLVPIQLAHTAYEVVFNVKCGEEIIEGAAVSVANQSLTTNSLGQAQINLISGEYEVVVSKEGYETTEMAINVNYDALTVDVNLVAIIPTYLVNFEVINEWDAQVTNATVIFNSLEHAAGVYAISEIEAGNYSYEVICNHYFPVQGSVEVVNEDVVVQIVLYADGTAVTNIKESDVRIFPNPTTGEFKLYLGENHSWKMVSINNALGQTAQTISLDGNSNISVVEFNLEGHPKGLYFIQLTGQGSIHLLKLVKK